MSNFQSLWIEGNSSCGKTTRLASLVIEWVQKKASFLQKPLILCANSQGKKNLGDTLLRLNPHCYPGKIRTVFGLMREDVILFYPLICQELDLPSILPLRLRPETEQDLATQLWRESLTPELLGIFGGEYDCVRRILDLMPLAATGGVVSENIADRLLESNIISTNNEKTVIELIGNLILQWRKWCLERGLLSYGLIYELYGRYLLPSNHYQDYLKNNYGAIFCDDVDDYPAIIKNLAEFFLNNAMIGAFTYNQTGKVRLGYNADPEYLQELASHCQQEFLSESRINSLGAKIETSVLNFLRGEFLQEKIPEGIKTIKTDLRGDLLQETADYIIKSIHSGEIQPREIAVIAAGLDEIARYTLVTMIENAGIKVKVLNEQRPLIASAQIRSILTLLPLLYQGLGRLSSPDMIAEMLVILSLEDIDLVRGGLLADYCYLPDLRSPSLLKVETFRRWDRLSHKSLQSYNQIRDWVNDTKIQIEKGDDNLLVVIDRIIKYFFTDKTQLNFSQITVIREFRETAQHFWQVQQRLNNTNTNHLVAQFISLLRKGTITANPFPLTTIPPLQEIQNNAVTIAPIYQYRVSRQHHRWQFWLDVGSCYWSQSRELFASSIFLKSWRSDFTIFDNPLSPLDYEIEPEEKRLTRIIKDLLGRVTEKIFLCHSTLDVNGLEQMGKLSPFFLLNDLNHNQNETLKIIET
ncbi:hypothetical protein [Geminocystis sp. NIES-3709]|uniref:hypothetical protein n=1 Tax=Geminocystis sp. NIES-3709 TaxID=1617448 RepID=UPI0005FC8C23|nr:hypothetical protein [Geminocystis sp. NIES-3709]BAQ64958.1 hypothetical cyanobacterial membrane protein [Geminocystis sp. NIES-3709]